MSKDVIKAKQEELIKLTSAFSAKFLDDEYKALIIKLIEKMGRKRPIPFARGKIEIWAAAIVQAIGSINFLYDDSFEPYVSTAQINSFFGTKPTTTSNKARQIRDMFQIEHFDPDFSTEKLDSINPMNSMVVVDGFIVPLDSLPEHVQKQVKEIRAKGGDVEITTK